MCNLRLSSCIGRRFMSRRQCSALASAITAAIMADITTVAITADTAIIVIDPRSEEPEQQQTRSLKGARVFLFLRTEKLLFNAGRERF